MSTETSVTEPGGSRDAGELFDAVVIGTGFGGAVAACRLAQAKKTVCILERGRRYGAGDFPRPATRPDNLPHTARWAWALDHGLWDVRDLQDTLAVQAAGYGGGSLVYANVHLRPPPEVFAKPTKDRPKPNGWPTVYSRRELDAYYDVVAAVLGVQPLPQKAWLGGPLPKAEAMWAAARGLGRSRWFFRPPLAIDFQKCVMCGECITGCQIHAKNTLDLNYLAAAEREAKVDVRTLAEAVKITEDADGYTVAYRDHITAAEATVRGKSVFLCAGSVNSTEILLRSKDRLPIPDESKKQIGRRFFANGDAIAMVYDTTRGPVPTPALGPTITTALLYNEGAADPRAAPPDWFLLQDGGYPKWLEPVLGLFRGEFWLGRNRIERAPESRAPLVPEAGRPEADSARAEPTALDGQAEKVARALLGLLDVHRTLQGPGVRPLAADGLDDILPPQIREKLVPELRRVAREVETREADAVSCKTLAEVSRRVLEKNPFLWGPVQAAEKLVEPHRLASALEILHQHFLKTPPGTAEPFSAAVLWPLVIEAAERLFLGERPNDRAFLMLGMGIDAAPGRLYPDDEERLLADWDLAANVPFSTMQERLMHDIADEMGGEMRLNPDLTARQRTVTVHSLGGCAMSDDPNDGVTNGDGRVWGTRALYVLDGAAMPGPLGVNPSATIAAIAERNVRKALEDKNSPIYTPTPVPLDPPLPGGPSLEEIRKRLGQTDGVLDPIAGMPPTPSEPRARALGLGFKEVMRGFYRAGAHENLPIRADFCVTIEDLNAFLVNPLHPATISGTVRLTRAGREVPYTATGTLHLLKRVEAVRALTSLFAEGFVDGLDLIRAQTLARLSLVQAGQRDDAEVALESLLWRLEKRMRRYEMDYDVELQGPGGPSDRYRFKGVKRIYGGPGLAAWTETTTLYVTLCDAASQLVGTGTMHVHLADFLETQLPSLHVTGADDDEVRIAWAFGRFARFFLGRLREVYLPRLEIPDPLGDRET